MKRVYDYSKDNLNNKKIKKSKKNVSLILEMDTLLFIENISRNNNMNMNIIGNELLRRIMKITEYIKL